MVRIRSIPCRSNIFVLAVAKVRKQTAREVVNSSIICLPTRYKAVRGTLSAVCLASDSFIFVKPLSAVAQTQDKDRFICLAAIGAATSAARLSLN